jgi:hypothetical protein
VTILKEAEDKGWYIARDIRGKEGLVPETHLDFSTGDQSLPVSKPASSPPQAPSAPAAAPQPQQPPAVQKAVNAMPAKIAVANVAYKAEADDELTFAVGFH